MASLYERNGTYYANFYEPGRGRKRTSLRTADRQTARALLAKFERLYLLGEADPWHDDMHEVVRPRKSLTLGEAFEAFLQSRRDMNVTESTLQTYRDTVGRLIREAGEEKSLGTLTAGTIRSYVHASGIATATKEKRYRTLRTFLGFHEVSVLENVEKPRVEQKLPKACTKEELEAITASMKEHYRECRRQGAMQPGETIWRASVFWASFLTGLRRSELARLKWKDVEGRSLVLRKQKRRREERLPISKKATRLFRSVRKGKREAPQAEEYVFAAPAAYRTQDRNEKAFANHLTRFFRRYRRRAGVREGITFHSLRAGFVTQLAKAGLNAVAIKRLARHSDIKTSLRYIEATGESFRSDLNGAFE